MQAMSSAASTVLLHQCSTTNRAFKVFLSLVNVLLFHVEPQKTAFRQCGVPDPACLELWPNVGFSGQSDWQTVDDRQKA